MTEITLSPFKQALLEVSLEQWHDLPAEKDIDLQPSKAFLEKSIRLIADVRRGNIGRMGTVLRRAILIAAILAALAITALAIPTIRKNTSQSEKSTLTVWADPDAKHKDSIHFDIVNFGTHYAFRFDQKQTATAPYQIKKYFKPAYIPMGYTETDSLVGAFSTNFIWQSDSGAYITFAQMVIPKNLQGPHPNAENVRAEMLYINDYPVFYVYNDRYKQYYWTDHEYFYGMTFYATISEEDCLKVINNIRLYENAIEK